MPNKNNQWPYRETVGPRVRLFTRMKKLLLLSAVLLGTVAASRAGVDVHIGFPLPPLPHIIIGAPAPPVVVQEPVVVAPPVYAPAPVVVAPPVVCAPRPVVVVRPRPVVYAYPHGHYSHRYEYLHHHR